MKTILRVIPWSGMLVGCIVLHGGIHRAQALQSAPDAPKPVEITRGPIVEYVTDTTAQIAWSTNVNAGTLLRYGLDRDRLDQSAGMPWGGFTHRVRLRDLKPDSTYYFRAESDQGQGTGTRAVSTESCFRTKPPGDQSPSPPGPR